MKHHFRFAAPYWRSLAREGGNSFGAATFERPWFGNTIEVAKLKADVTGRLFYYS